MPARHNYEKYSLVSKPAKAAQDEQLPLISPHPDVLDRLVHDPTLACANNRQFNVYHNVKKNPRSYASAPTSSASSSLCSRSISSSDSGSSGSTSRSSSPTSLSSSPSSSSSTRAPPRPTGARRAASEERIADRGAAPL